MTRDDFANEHPEGLQAGKQGFTSLHSALKMVSVLPQGSATTRTGVGPLGCPGSSCPRLREALGWSRTHSPLSKQGHYPNRLNSSIPILKLQFKAGGNDRQESPVSVTGRVGVSSPWDVQLRGDGLVLIRIICLLLNGKARVSPFPGPGLSG